MTNSNGSNGNGNGGSVIPLSRFHAAVARPRGADRVDALISAPDAPAQVAALSVPELYALVAEVGLADTQELIALATPEQLRGCLDLDLWDRDRLDDDAARPWLTAVMEAGYEKLGQLWEQLDSELAALILQRWTRIYDLSLEEEVPDSSELPIVRTPDTFFAVEITAERDEDVQLVVRLIDDLYKADMVLARHTLMAARTEPPAELEEGSYRWRSGRMADLGYSEFYEALEVFRPLDPGRIQIGEDTAFDAGAIAEGDEARVPRRLPVAMADAVSGQSFLARALDRVDGADAERLETAVIHLVNRVLSAARARPGDPEATQVGAEHAAATLSLGLETVSAGDLARAEQALRTVSLTRLHRAGYTVTRRLARLARALAPRAGAAADADRALVAALLSARPWFPRELDDPPAVGIRPFSTVSDVRRAAEALTRLALRIAVVEEGLGVDLVAAAAAPEQPELDDYARTALARAAGGGEASPEPLDRAELPRALDAAARDRARAALLARLDAAGVTAGREYLDGLVDSWLAELEETLAETPRDPDPRFVRGVLLRRN